MERAAHRAGNAFLQLFGKDACLRGEELIIECPVILSGLLRLPVLFRALTVCAAMVYNISTILYK